MAKFTKGNNLKNENNFVKKKSQDYLLTILYQLTKFEATSCKSLRDIFIKIFQCQFQWN